LGSVISRLLVQVPSRVTIKSEIQCGGCEIEAHLSQLLE
jgi:hypothetical protein